MQLDDFGPSDTEVLLPLLRGSVRARIKQTVQHGQEQRPLHIKPKAPIRPHAADHPGDAKLAPQPLKNQRRADARVALHPQLSLLVQIDDFQAAAETQQRLRQSVHLAGFAQLIQSTQRTENFLLDYLPSR